MKLTLALIVALTMVTEAGAQRAAAEGAVRYLRGRE